MIFQTESADISAEALGRLVKDFLTAELPRRARLYAYYQGTQGVRKGRAAEGRPDNRLTANYARYITDVQTGYFMGVPPALTFARRRVGERMQEALREASFGGMLYAAARDMSICGEGYLLTCVTPRGPRLIRLSPTETFMLTTGVGQELVGAVRLCEESAHRVCGELYTPGFVTPWQQDGDTLRFGPRQGLPLPGLAVSRFCNNLDAAGDFEPVTSLLDAYNLLLSGAMDDMQSVANAFLALYGAMGATREDIEQANRSRVLCMAENGKAEFVVKNLSPDAIHLLKDTLAEDMLAITMTPNLNDEAFGSNSSGVALEYKLWGAEQARSAKEQGFSGGLYHVVGLFYQALSLLGMPAGGGCTARFYKNLPQDLTRLCSNLDKLGDTVSHRTKLELLPFVQDAEAELERLRQEKKGV